MSEARSSARRSAASSDARDVARGVGTPKAAGRQRARRGEGEALHEQILAAAASLLAETGNEEAVSIRAVAERVGVTPPSIYLHFADKEALLEAVCVEAFASFDSRLAAACEPHDDPVAALYAMGRAYVEFALERPEHYRFMFMRRADEALHEPTAAELQTLSGLARVIATVASAQRSGSIAPERDSIEVAYVLWAAVHGVAALLIAKPHFPWSEQKALVESVLDMCLHGVLAPPSPAGPGRALPAGRA